MYIPGKQVHDCGKFIYLCILNCVNFFNLIVMCILFNHLVLKVISMNMWGIHRDLDLNFFSRSRSKSIFRCESCEHRKERMIGAAEIIKSSQYDFIMFQVHTSTGV